MSFFVSVGVTKRYTCSTMYMLCCWPTTLRACNGLLQHWLNQLKPRTVVFVTLRLTPVACSLCLHQELSTQIVLQSKTSIKESVCIAYLLDRGPKLSINYGRETAVLQGKIGIKKLNISSQMGARNTHTTLCLWMDLSVPTTRSLTYITIGDRNMQGSCALTMTGCTNLNTDEFL